MTQAEGKHQTLHQHSIAASGDPTAKKARVDSLQRTNGVTDEFRGKMNGCTWITSWHRKYNNKTAEYCGKIPDKGSEHCPKHVLFAEHESRAPERRKAERDAQKAYKKAKEEALQNSPLRAENAAFSEKRTGYER